LEKINAAKPDVLLVRLGKPLQELWLEENWDKVDAGVALTGARSSTTSRASCAGAPACSPTMAWSRSRASQSSRADYGGATPPATRSSYRGYSSSSSGARDSGVFGHGIKPGARYVTCPW
jgi:hypothetical protein